MKQGALAEAMEISASYLNLIEHNRRRIGGKLLSRAARALATDVVTLTQGAEAALIEGLRDALAQIPDGAPNIAQAEDFAARFPDWAGLTIAQARRIAGLQRTVENLSDRMTHDPFLSEALHDVLSTVTAIRSTSAILAEDGEIDREWQTRFHRNLFEDSQRLAESAQSLVGYLDAGEQADATIAAPQEELEAWLAAHHYHLAALEHGQVRDMDIEAVLPNGAAGSARTLMLAYAAQYRADALTIPLSDLADALGEITDPQHLAQRFQTDLVTVFRRLATMPDGWAGRAVGLVVCDGSGTLTFRKPLDGFALPRFGAACPLWPMYQALSRPHTPIRQVVEQVGQLTPRFTCYAVAHKAYPGGFDSVPVVTAAMLILPHDSEASGYPVGTSCRICPRRACAARREPAIVAEHSA